MIWIWSATLTLIGITGWYFVMRKHWWGWGISLAVQGVWVAYAFATRQYPFLASAALYGAIAFRGLRTWYRADRLLRLEPADLTARVVAMRQATAGAQIEAWAVSAITSACDRTQTAIDVIQDHRLAYDPTRCLACSWQPEHVAPAYTIEDQHQAHVEREIFHALASRSTELPAWAV